MGRLTTHVLDTTQGRPGSGIDVSVARVVDDVRDVIATAKTNADGRCDAPLLEGAALTPGIYELTFSVASYFARSGVRVPDPPFIGDVVLRFGVADASQHYHVPLLVTPCSYATYRGS